MGLTTLERLQRHRDRLRRFALVIDHLRTRIAIFDHDVDHRAGEALASAESLAHVVSEIGIDAAKIADDLLQTADESEPR